MNLDSRRPPDEYSKPTCRTSSDRSRDSYVSPFVHLLIVLDRTARPYHVEPSSYLISSRQIDPQLIEPARSRLRERSLGPPTFYPIYPFSLNSRAQVSTYATSTCLPLPIPTPLHVPGPQKLSQVSFSIFSLFKLTHGLLIRNTPPFTTPKTLSDGTWPHTLVEMVLWMAAGPGDGQRKGSGEG